jgi:hypothetical protein
MLAEAAEHPGPPFPACTGIALFLHEKNLLRVCACKYLCVSTSVISGMYCDFEYSLVSVLCIVLYSYCIVLYSYCIALCYIALYGLVFELHGVCVCVLGHADER